MWTRIAYFARETMVSLRRNVLMTIAGIATVAVSLVAVRRHPDAVEVGRPRHRAHQGRRHARDLHDRRRPPSSRSATVAGQLDGDKGPKGNVKSLPSPRQARRLRGVQAHLPAQPRPREQHHAPQDLPESFRVVPKKAELTETVQGRVQDRSRASNRSRRRVRRSRGCIDVTNTVRLHLHRDLARAARRRRCS